MGFFRVRFRGQAKVVLTMFCLFSPSHPIVHEGNLRRRPPSWETLTGHRYARGNSGTTEPVTMPVVPLFPGPPKLGGHNSEKRRNRPGIQGQRTAGIIEVIFSHIWTAKVRTRWNLARNGFFQGPFSGFGRGCLTIIILGADRESVRARGPAGPGGFITEQSGKDSWRDAPAAVLMSQNPVIALPCLEEALMWGSLINT